MLPSLLANTKFINNVIWKWRHRHWFSLLVPTSLLVYLICPIMSNYFSNQQVECVLYSLSSHPATTCGIAKSLLINSFSLVTPSFFHWLQVMESFYGCSPSVIPTPRDVLLSLVEPWCSYIVSTVLWDARCPITYIRAITTNCSINLQL